VAGLDWLTCHALEADWLFGRTHVCRTLDGAVLASRKAGKPVIPRLFWYMSVVGSLMTLSYFLFSKKSDSVGVLQNLFPAFTAFYSLYLDIKAHGWHEKKE
jgi:lipid-A-disaccharide synthase-like uncharacterized protein